MKTLLLLAALASASAVADPVVIAGYAWESHPNAKPCAASAIKWEQRLPYNGPGFAHVDWSTCTIISALTEERAQAYTLSGPNFAPLESLWKHERRHLEEALQHPGEINET